MARPMRKPANYPPGAGPRPPQQAQYLLNLPRELRDEIYIALFASTRLTFGERLVAPASWRRMRSARNAFALLWTCQQMRAEIQDMWLSHVQFNFEDPEAMLDTLSDFGPQVMSKTRHVRVVGQPLCLRPGIGYTSTPYTTASLLQMLPALRLGTLTVLGHIHAHIAYETLDDLVSRGNGWKELHFVTRNSRMLGYEDSNYDGGLPVHGRNHRRKLQPHSWEHMMQARDGQRLEPYVRIYRSTLPRTRGSILKAQNREPLEQTAFEEQLPKYESGANPDLALDCEAPRELLVIVKRGRAADITQRTTPPYNEKLDVRYWAKDTTWHEISNIQVCHRYPDSHIQTDIYGDVDDVAWPVSQPRLNRSWIFDPITQ